MLHDRFTALMIEAHAELDDLAGHAEGAGSAVVQAAHDALVRAEDVVRGFKATEPAAAPVAAPQAPAEPVAAPTAPIAAPEVVEAPVPAGS
jgi:hypothetical protein